MKSPVVRSCVFTATSVLCLAIAPRVRAQSAPSADTGADGDEPITLSPFVVSGAEDSGYQATATLAGTRIRTELKDVGSSITAVTKKFMQDTNSKDITDLLVYTPSTEVNGGQGGNYLGRGAGEYLTDPSSGSTTQARVRGLALADNTRDFFLTDIPFDSYNVGRVDLQRGPNAILFGIGSPAGIVNTSLNQAAFKNANKVEAQFDNFGSARETLDLNRVVLPHELAVRVSLLHDDTKYRQKPAFKNDKRVYGAVRWDPAFLNRGSAHTMVTADFEAGHISRNDPVNTPPLDAITPWFYAYGADQRKQGFSAAYAPGTEATTGTYIGNLTAITDPWLGPPGNRVYGGEITTFNGGSQGPTYATGIYKWPNASGQTPLSAVGANRLKGITTYNNYARNAGLVGSTIGGFKAKSLTDPTIFDYYDYLLSGPNQGQFNRFHAFDAAVSQTFLNDRLGVELRYDRQYAKYGYTSLLWNDGTSVTVDIMKTLIDGSPNPNFGRPVVYAGPGNFGWVETTRDDKRVTAFGELNFNDITGRDSLLARLLGRNVFTGLYNEQGTDSFKGNGPGYYIDPSFGPVSTIAINDASHSNIFAAYLGAPLTGASASGIDVRGIQDTLHPTNSTVNYYNDVTGTWQLLPLTTINNTLADDRTKTYTTARKTGDKVTSKAIVWQGYWLKGTLIPMVGYREDKDAFRDAGSPPSLGLGMVNPYDPAFSLPTVGASSTVRSKTYSLVTHLPNSWRRRLPGAMDVSLIFDKSENFQPDSSRVDLLGNQVANPAGNTKEYGIAFSGLNDRLSLKVVHYETRVSNATLSGNLGSHYYLIGAIETWGQAAAIAFKNSMAPGGPLKGSASTLYGLSSDGHQVTWHPNEPKPTSGPIDPNTGHFAYSQAGLDEAYAEELASVNAWLSPQQQVPAGFQKAWGMTDYASGGYAQNYGAAGVAVTGDTLSKGTEIELIARPLKGLDVSVNASKTFASESNLAKSYVDWINKRYSQFLNTPAGAMRIWNGMGDSQDPVAKVYGGGGESALGKYTRETMSDYRLWLALEGSAVPELRPWRFNAVANYAFQNAPLKGVHVGGGYRWQDADTTGFPVIGAGTATDPYRFDVNHPYKGSTEGLVDGWIGYSHALTDRITWHIQLNVRNIFATKKLQRVTVEPDGSPAGYRIPEPRTISLTNSITF